MNAKESRRLWQSGRGSEVDPLGPDWDPITSVFVLLAGLTVIAGLVWKLLS